MVAAPIVLRPERASAYGGYRIVDRRSGRGLTGKRGASHSACVRVCRTGATMACGNRFSVGGEGGLCPPPQSETTGLCCGSGCYRACGPLSASATMPRATTSRFRPETPFRRADPSDSPAGAEELDRTGSRRPERTPRSRGPSPCPGKGPGSQGTRSPPGIRANPASARPGAMDAPPPRSPLCDPVSEGPRGLGEDPKKGEKRIDKTWGGKYFVIT
jgi:hypothetical protein